MRIDYFWIPETNRTSVVGTNIIKLAISEAKKLKLKYINLDTYSFQAPIFYEKMGFVEVCRY